MYVCVCARARGSVHANVAVGAQARACACERVALLIQNATRMYRILLSFVAPRSPLYFSTLSHKRRDFRKKSY